MEEPKKTGFLKRIFGVGGCNCNAVGLEEIPEEENKANPAPLKKSVSKQEEKPSDCCGFLDN